MNTLFRRLRSLAFADVVRSVRDSDRRKVFEVFVTNLALDTNRTGAPCGTGSSWPFMP